MRRSHVGSIVIAIGVALTVAVRGTAAWAIDGKPTAIANGTCAVVADPRLAPGEILLAPSVFPQRYSAQIPVRFSEDEAALRRALAPATLHSAWRWEFGDGALMEGKTAWHRYRKPGTYRVIVAAYFAAYHDYYPFDEILITITR